MARGNAACDPSPAWMAFTLALRCPPGLAADTRKKSTAANCLCLFRHSVLPRQDVLAAAVILTARCGPEEEPAPQLLLRRYSPTEDRVRIHRYENRPAAVSECSPA